MSAILRISGSSINVDELAARSTLVPYRIDRTGVGKAEQNVLHYLVAESTDDWNAMLALVSSFLKRYGEGLRYLVVTQGVEHAVIDIAVDFPLASAAKFLVVHNSILRQIADLGLGLEFSVYGAE